MRVHVHSAGMPPMLLVWVRCAAVGFYDHHCVLPVKRSVSLIAYTYVCIHLRYVFASAIQRFQKKVIMIHVFYIVLEIKLLPLMN